MPDFAFTQAERAYREQLRELVLRELLPRYREGDTERRYPYEQIQRVLSFADEFWRGREGERNLTVSGITAEEVARGDFNCVLPCLGPAVTERFLGEAPEHLKNQWIPRLLRGEAVIGLCLTEEGAGSDMAGIAATAERKGDVYVVNGIKTSVSFLNADIFYVFARTESAPGDWRGLTAFLVPRETAGLSFEAYEDLGCRSIPRGILRLENVEVPADHVVGEPGKAFAMIRRFFEINRAMIGLKCLGAAAQSVEETCDAVSSRTQFGVPLATFQGVAFPLAEAATHLELGRWLCYRVLWLAERGHPADRESAMAKWWVPRTAVSIIHQCLLLNGHRGYTRDLPIEQRLRDVVGWQIGDGTEQIMKLIISRQMFGKEAALR